MDDLHTQFHKHLDDRYPLPPEDPQAQSVLDQIGRVQAYINRLLLAYKLATQRIRELEEERDRLKLERHLLVVELAKHHQGRNHGHNHCITSETPEIEPSEGW